MFRGETLELLLETRYPEEGIDFVTATLASLDSAQRTAFGKTDFMGKPPGPALHINSENPLLAHLSQSLHINSREFSEKG